MESKSEKTQKKLLSRASVLELKIKHKKESFKSRNDEWQKSEKGEKYLEDIEHLEILFNEIKNDIINGGNLIENSVQHLNLKSNDLIKKNKKIMEKSVVYTFSEKELQKLIKDTIIEFIRISSNEELKIKEIVEQKEIEEDLISGKDACAYLKISMPTLILWRNEKELPYRDYNGRYFYSKKELVEYGKLHIKK